MKRQIKSEAVSGDMLQRALSLGTCGESMSDVGEAHTLISDQALYNQDKSGLFYTRGLWEIEGSFQKTMEAYTNNGGILSSRSYSLPLCRGGICVCMYMCM